MKELVRKNDYYFNESYEGINGAKRVVCILDNNCVRYVKYINNKKAGKNEYQNHEKEKCFTNATKWLNK